MDNVISQHHVVIYGYHTPELQRTFAYKDDGAAAESASDYLGAVARRYGELDYERKAQLLTRHNDLATDLLLPDGTPITYAFQFLDLKSPLDVNLLDHCFLNFPTVKDEDLDRRRLGVLVAHNSTYIGDKALEPSVITAALGHQTATLDWINSFGFAARPEDLKFYMAFMNSFSEHHAKRREFLSKALYIDPYALVVDG